MDGSDGEEESGGAGEDGVGDGEEDIADEHSGLSNLPPQARRHLTNLHDPYHHHRTLANGSFDMVKMEAVSGINLLQPSYQCDARCKKSTVSMSNCVHLILLSILLSL